MVFNVVLGASCTPCLRMGGLHCLCPLGCEGKEGAGGFTAVPGGCTGAVQPWVGLWQGHHQVLSCS